MRFSFVIHTLGCKVNQYDSERLATELCKLGFERRRFGEPADICIVNTCAVTQVAEQKSRKAVSRARRMYEGSILVALGCAVELHRLRGGGKFKGSDISFGVCDPPIIASELMRHAEANRRLRSQHTHSECSNASQAEPVKATGDGQSSAQRRVRSFLKVQDGCERMCAYCVVPFLRGKPRSRPIEDVLTEAKRLVNNGCKEIVLTGVCLGSYGSDLNDGVDILRLIERLCELDGLIRLRLSSLDPKDISYSLIRLAAGCEKLCPHFHISLQSGDDEILKAMNRGYTTAQYEGIVDLIRNAISDVAITTDVLVGFPGETNEHFERTVRFVERMEFARVHVFKFSPRPFTKAASMEPRVTDEELDKRTKVMLSLAQELSRRFKERFIGRQLDVLVEETGLYGGIACSEGLTGNYIRVRINVPLKLGDIIRVNLTAIGDGDFVLGELQ
ncbi:MAG: tRNA (N(6)-L-threonylcarbamoyladenosine(37)-C(2))-methylthiotransferase MtaB [Armatimonadota bacterium]|nr:tRNA (N(6)-L-threonylcarbamoyladenosine(37)-C(2))-methylthiotransferase MtaB [Armatimonadota bacterium]MCX7776717.1 tRNA (N(6)-L-threonylcarbamoyladenosine(37)-C(2))-methylthiotransferase MtaB [Armatimonadota bacterium]MDW8025786.1 tRNA (N(6)-L-threonylcarbamoyladenosine(37)-C(2))-methylthiotransferase MtaB [Armatimonadota bacterium]